MSIQQSQSKKLGDWKKGRELTAKNFQESVSAIKDIQKTLKTPSQVINQSKGFKLYRVTETVDLELEPITWTIKAVLVNDTFNEEDPPLLEAVSEELTLKLSSGTYGVSVGDIVTNVIGAKDPNFILVTPLSPIHLVYKATEDESEGEIKGEAMNLDLSTVGYERTFKVFPDA